MKKILLEICKMLPVAFLLLSLNSAGVAIEKPHKIQTNIEQGNEVRVFPNPFKNSFTIENKKGFNEAFFFDVTGKVVFKFPLHEKLTPINDNSFEISKLPDGIYFLTLSGGNNENMTIRIIKSNR
jgi:hypothetical protein